ncbi:uncharacterized protein LOC113919628 [Zalophus californianus]|uniref:Uncharacterized protein LOC113919628 n=1 Tax=Zalophus californianus TaxID=9704 RepID=A0A6J2CQC1_ZALCA|nr:uncharacterized protein LOC113919628 [Zalophus californianus]
MAGYFLSFPRPPGSSSVSLRRAAGCRRRDTTGGVHGELHASALLPGFRGNRALARRDAGWRKGAAACLGPGTSTLKFCAMLLDLDLCLTTQAARRSRVFQRRVYLACEEAANEAVRCERRALRSPVGPAAVRWNFTAPGQEAPDSDSAPTVSGKARGSAERESRADKRGEVSRSNRTRRTSPLTFHVKIATGDIWAYLCLRSFKESSARGGKVQDLEKPMKKSQNREDSFQTRTTLVELEYGPVALNRIVRSDIFGLNHL